jgi:hypothetical protein
MRVWTLCETEPNPIPTTHPEKPKVVGEGLLCEEWKLPEGTTHVTIVLCTLRDAASNIDTCRVVAVVPINDPVPLFKLNNTFQLGSHRWVGPPVFWNLVEI